MTSISSCDDETLFKIKLPGGMFNSVQSITVVSDDKKMLMKFVGSLFETDCVNRQYFLQYRIKSEHHTLFAEVH